MTPVDINNADEPLSESSVCQATPDSVEKASSAARAIFHASSKPLVPVTAFAHPLFKTNLFARPRVPRNTAVETCTGMAFMCERYLTLACRPGSLWCLDRGDSFSREHRAAINFNNARLGGTM